MAAILSVTPNLPNQKQGTGDELALVIEEFTGIVEGTLERVSKAAPFVDVRRVTGTATVTNEGIGESTLQVLVKGEAPPATINQANRINLTVDTTVIARNWVSQLDDFQKNYAFKEKVAVEHGKAFAKFHDEAHFIQAAHAAAISAATGTYGLPGHKGGTTITLSAAGDERDAARILAALSDLFAEMEEKDVDPQADNLMVALRPKAYYALLQAEEIINTNYVFANGKEIVNAKVLKAYGVPVVSSNNVPGRNITGHFMSNARNGNAYDGDFTKLVAVAFSPRAILAGETVPLSANVWWDDLTKGYYIDSWMAFAATPDRAEFAGRVVLP